MTEYKNSVCTAEKEALDKPCKYFVKFNSIADANNWLRVQDSIVITNFAVSTKSRFSFPANCIDVVEVRLEYIRYAHPTNYSYGIDEQSFMRAYASAKTEKLRDAWKNRNPDKQCIHCIKSTNKRYLAGSGFGFISFVRDKLVVLYR